MAFDYYLRNKRPWPKGHDVAEEIKLNTSPELTTIGREGSELGAAIIAPEDTLKVRYRLSWTLSQDPVFVSFRDNGRLLEPYTLYGNKTDELEEFGRVKTINFTALDVLKAGKDTLYNDLEALNFKRTFLSLKCDFIVDCKTSGGSMTITPPGCVNGRPIYFYGGYFKGGSPLEAIEPITFVPFARRGETGVHFTRLSGWLSRGVPINGSIGRDGSQLQGEFEPRDLLSLDAWLKGGHGEVRIPLGVDSSGKAYWATYISWGFEEKNLIEPFLTLTFKRKEA
jgi:hypothetical protein